MRKEFKIFLVALLWPLLVAGQSSLRIDSVVVSGRAYANQSLPIVGAPDQPPTVVVTQSGRPQVAKITVLAYLYDPVAVQPFPTAFATYAVERTLPDAQSVRIPLAGALALRNAAVTMKLVVMAYSTLPDNQGQQFYASAIFNLAPYVAAPLGVDLASFTGSQPQPGLNRLAWRVGTERNVSRYEVQTSPDGAAFTPRANVPATGSSSYGYDFASEGRAWYARLRLVDNDGSAAYSAVVALPAAPAVAGEYLLRAGEVLFAFALPSGDGALTLIWYDTAGRLLATTAASEPAPALPSGVYLVTLRTRAGSYVSRRVLLP